MLVKLTYHFVVRFRVKVLCVHLDLSLVDGKFAQHSATI